MRKAGFDVHGGLPHLYSMSITSYTKVTHKRGQGQKHIGEAFEEMNHSEGQLWVMVDPIPTLTFIRQPNGTTVFLNQQWLDNTALSMERALTGGRKILIHPGDLDKNC